MNRFQENRKKERIDRSFFLSLFLFAAVTGLVWNGVTTISEQTARQQKKNLEEAVQRDIVTCYALEGRYPESLDYLKEHYGLTYNEERYLVNYEVTGSNLMPDVTVMEKKKGA